MPAVYLSCLGELALRARDRISCRPRLTESSSRRWGGGVEKDSIALPPSLSFLSDRRSYNFHRENTKHAGITGNIDSHELSLKFVFMKITFITQGDLSQRLDRTTICHLVCTDLEPEWVIQLLSCFPKGDVSFVIVNKSLSPP